MVHTRSSQCRENTSPDPNAKPINHPVVSRNLKPLIEEANYFTASIQMLSSFRVINEIKKKLTRRQVGLFEKTCFGQFLKLRPFQFSAQLVHNILLRQLVCSEKENSLWFRIGGKKCEFGLKDFALITGLNCSEYVSPDILEGKLSNRIRDKYFNGSDKVYDKDIAQVFREYRGNSDDDAVKLAQLYLLEAVLLNKPRRTDCHNFFIRLVNNADEFNRFPWGRYVYEFTVESMKRALEDKVKKLGDELKQGESNSPYQATYFLKGFPHALQFWAYECMPLIREKFGERIDGNTPRMLNWAHTKRPKVVDWKNEVFSGDEFQVENGLQPTEEEFRKDYFRYFLAKQTATKDNEKFENGGEIHMNEEGADNDGKKYDNTTRRKARKECGDDRNSEPRTLRKMIREEIRHAFYELSGEIIPILTKQQSNVAETDFDRQPDFEKLKNKVFNGTEFQVENGPQPTEQELHEDYSRHVLAKQRVKKRKKTAITKEDKSPKEQAEEIVMKGQYYKKSENGNGIHVNEDSGDNDGKRCDDITPKKARIEGENDLNSELLTWRKTFREELNTAKSALMAEIRATVITEPNKQRSNDAETDFDVVSIEVDEGDKQRKHNRCNVQGSNEIPCFTVDLFEHPNHDDKVEFDEWVKVGLQKNSKRNKYFDVSNELHPGFDFTILTCTKKDWFLSLDRAAQWLNSSHIDVALYFIRKKKENHPDVFQHSCTTTDSLFYSKLSTRYLKFKQDPENFLWDKEPLIQKTVEGLEPQSSLPWVDVDTVYIPVNVNKKHWVVAALDLKNRRLNIYDSYHAAKHDKEVVSACHPIAEMVPWLLKSVGFYDARNDIHIAQDATTPLDVKLVQDVPQQENGGDCGMFMLKFTEFLMQDAPLGKCNQEAISFFRNKMAVELYAYGKKMLAKK